MNKKNILKITYSALCLALCYVLPFFTAQIPQIGSMLSPMHIPVLLCGFLCGPLYGAIVGFIAPLFRSVLTGGYPPLYPTAIAMAFELCAYGILTGVMYKLLPKKNVFIYVSLVISMLGGRVVWGIVRFILATVSTDVFTFKMFLAGAFVNAIPAIILHVILVPVIVFALKKAALMPTAVNEPSSYEEKEAQKE